MISGFKLVFQLDPSVWCSLISTIARYAIPQQRGLNGKPRTELCCASWGKDRSSCRYWSSWLWAAVNSCPTGYKVGVWVPEVPAALQLWQLPED